MLGEYIQFDKASLNMLQPAISLEYMSIILVSNKELLNTPFCLMLYLWGIINTHGYVNNETKEKCTCNI